MVGNGTCEPAVEEPSCSDWIRGGTRNALSVSDCSGVGSGRTIVQVESNYMLTTGSGRAGDVKARIGWCLCCSGRLCGVRLGGLGFVGGDYLFII